METNLSAAILETCLNGTLYKRVHTYGREISVHYSGEAR